MPPVAPMLRITLSVEGELVIDRLLQGLEDRARDMTPVWPEVVTIFRSLVRAAFDTEGASTGATWAPLAESTQRDRERQGFAPEHPILQRTTRLFRSLVLGDEGHVTSAPESLSITSEVEYFKYHQSNKPRKRLPRRAPVLLTMDDRHALMRPIRLYLTGRAA